MTKPLKPNTFLQPREDLEQVIPAEGQGQFGDEEREAIKAAISGSPPQKVSPTAAAQETRTTKADERAAAIYPLILDIKTSGATSLRAIAKELTERKIETPARQAKVDQGKAVYGDPVWHPQQVALIIKRIEIIC